MAGKPKRIVWGVPSFWIERFPLYYGRHRGFFEKRGLRLAIRYYWGGPELAQAVARGEVSIGEMGLPPFLKAYSDGLPARVIGSSTIQRLDHYLVGRTEIDTIADLKGRQVGILSFGSCDEYFARHMLRASGVDPDSEAELVPLGSAYCNVDCFCPSRAAAVPQVDAGFVEEPFVAQGEKLGWVKTLGVVRDYFPSYQWGIILARDDFLEREIDTAHRAMGAFRESCRAIAGDPDAAAAFGAQVFGLKKEVFRRALLRDLDHWELDARLDFAGMENCLRVQRDAGAAAASLDLKRMVRQL